MRKGIILAGGSGTRLHPLTLAVSKQLMPVYDKPLIYYPLTTLMLARIRDILIITTQNDLPMYQKVLGDGSQWGISLSYAVQEKPEGLAQAYIIGEKFVGNSASALILGDNIYYASGLIKRLESANARCTGATVFGYSVENPSQYGVIKFSDSGEIVDLIEKPTTFVSNCAVTGLYFYDSEVTSIAKTIRPSARGELEITDINRIYLKNKKLNVELLGRGAAWLDAGTHDALLDAANFIRLVETRQGLKIGCPEEVAYHHGFISKEQIQRQAELASKTSYGTYLKKLLSEPDMVT